jgi:hypothetical protein
MAQNDSTQKDLTSLIKKSSSLKTKFSEQQMTNFIKKVETLPEDKKTELKNMLLEEREELKPIAARAREIATEYTEKLPNKMKEIMRTVFANAEKEEKEKESGSLSSLEKDLNS